MLVENRFVNHFLGASPPSQRMQSCLSGKIGPVQTCIERERKDSNGVCVNMTFTVSLVTQLSELFMYANNKSDYCQLPPLVVFQKKRIIKGRNILSAET